MTRDEHLAWCKKNALEYLDRGDVRQGFTSMLSDLSKHPELKDHMGGKIGVGFMLLPGWIDNDREVRRWIVGFN
jgi:hypothetical protein